MSNIRKYKGYAIVKFTVHTVNGACLPIYKIYLENELGQYKRDEGFIHAEDKLKDAKDWIDKELLIGKVVKINDKQGKITEHSGTFLYIMLDNGEKTGIDYNDIDKYLVLE